MGSRTTVCHLSAAAASLLLTTDAADGYVRMRSPDGAPLEWRRGCPALTVVASAEHESSRAEMMAALEAARGAWSNAACRGLPVEIVEGGAGAVIEYDGASTVVWRDEDHCDAPEHATDEICLSPNAAAVTSVFYYEDGARSGEVVETDIEINGAIALASDGRAGAYDLVAALTHELGHVFGLEHTCETIPGRAPMIDSSGAPVPSCFPTSALPEAIRTATMFPYLTPGDLSVRTPEPDERGAVCDLYGAHDGRCEYVGPSCGCRGGDRGGMIGAALVALFFLRRRRARRGASRR